MPILSNYPETLLQEEENRKIPSSRETAVENGVHFPGGKAAEA
jgi:hypothetical protein